MEKMKITEKSNETQAQREKCYSHDKLMWRDMGIHGGNSAIN